MDTEEGIIKNDTPKKSAEKNQDELEQETEEDGAGPSSSSGSGHIISTNRQMRNMAEKMRRDKLNYFIHELSNLVPIISFSPKKLDKTSILRLAATYIRLHNVVFGNQRRDRRSSQQQKVQDFLPGFLASFNWSESLLEDMEQVLLIVTGAGKVVFVSHTVEKILGHTQIELMGQSLFNLTYPEDLGELRKQLTPDEDQNTLVLSGVDDSSTDSSSGPPTPPPRVPRIKSSPDLHSESSVHDVHQRRSFCIRLRQRPVSRTDHPQFELVNIVGHLRVPPRRSTIQPSTSRKKDTVPNNNDVVLVAVVRPLKQKRLTQLSLMEAFREEFVTRHTIDGQIVYTDHRISTVSGYFAEEVTGVTGFRFMHKEDMRWTMIGLRQMYYRGQSYGMSCYRLKSKNGEFIYIRTHGYLELNESNDAIQSLVCINSLVPTEEGEELMRQMKELYSPVILSKQDNNIARIAGNLSLPAAENIPAIQDLDIKPRQQDEEDADELDYAVQQMISNLPSTSNAYQTGTIPFNQADSIKSDGKVKSSGKCLLPVNQHTSKTGGKIPAHQMSGMSPTSCPESSPPPPPLQPPPPPVLSCTPTRTSQLPPQKDHRVQRPTVLRVAPRHLAKQDQDIFASRPPDKPPANSERGVSVVKRLRTDEEGRDIVVESNSVVCQTDANVMDHQITGKRKHMDDVQFAQQFRTDVIQSVQAAALSPHTHTPFTVPPPLIDISPLIDIAPAELDMDFFRWTSSDMPDDSTEDDLRSSLIIPVSDPFEDQLQMSNEATYSLEHSTVPDELVKSVPSQLYPLEHSTLNELVKTHQRLGSRMQLQETQIHAIEHDLHTVPSTNMDKQVYKENLTQLKAQHKKQQQLLMTLQQDHQNIQQCQEHLKVCTSHQDVGV